MCRYTRIIEKLRALNLDDEDGGFKKALDDYCSGKLQGDWLLIEQELIWENGFVEDDKLVNEFAIHLLDLHNHNLDQKEKQMTTITFRTATQAALFSCELKGQISDGHWENLEEPEDHWKSWCDAEVVIGENVGRDFDASYDDYDFADPELLAVAGDRMICIASLALGTWTNREIWALECCFHYTGWRGIPTWISEERRLFLQSLNLEKARRDVETSTYDSASLMASLREMEAAIKVRRS